MVASVVDYGRRVKHVPIALVSLLNETDSTARGPLVAADQYAHHVKAPGQAGRAGYADAEIVDPRRRGPSARRTTSLRYGQPGHDGPPRHVGAHDYAADWRPG